MLPYGPSTPCHTICSEGSVHAVAVPQPGKGRSQQAGGEDPAAGALLGQGQVLGAGPPQDLRASRSSLPSSWGIRLSGSPSSSSPSYLLQGRRHAHRRWKTPCSVRANPACCERGAGRNKGRFALCNPILPPHSARFPTQKRAKVHAGGAVRMLSTLQLSLSAPAPTPHPGLSSLQATASAGRWSAGKASRSAPQNIRARGLQLPCRPLPPQTPLSTRSSVPLLLPRAFLVAGIAAHPAQGCGF